MGSNNESIKVIGAGPGRTGTFSLKLALEKLLGGKCYHGCELIFNPRVVSWWEKVDMGELPASELFREDYTAIVDLPGSSIWPELAKAYPSAKILLSTRSSESWWESMNNTTLNSFRTGEFKQIDPKLHDFFLDKLKEMFCEDLYDEYKMKQAYENHNQKVRETVPADRLIEWKLGDGWEPLCNALNLPIPKEDFPNTNSTKEYWAGNKWLMGAEIDYALLGKYLV